jgi:hypothetical protein
VPEDTAAPEPESVFVGGSDVLLMPRVQVGDDSYSFQALEGMEVEVEGTQVAINLWDVLYIFMNRLENEGMANNEEVSESYSFSLSQNIDQMIALGSSPFSVSGYEGLAVDFTGMLNTATMNGQLVTVYLNADEVFAAYSFAVGAPDDPLWEDLGQEVFHAVLGTVEIYE